MIQNPSYESSPQRRGFSFVPAIIFLMPLVILIGSTILYFSDWRGGHPVNNGVLLIEKEQKWSPAMTGSTEQETQQLAETHERKWLIVKVLQDCTNCRNELDQLSRLHQAFGKNQSRISPVAITENELSDSKESLHLRVSPDAYTFFSNLSPEQDRFIIDPQGWVVMGYDSRHSDKMLLKDLKRLL